MENKNKVESRRSFLKKAVYAVPAVVALGQITNPVKSSAGSFVGGGKEIDKNGNPTTTPSVDKTNAYNIFGQKK